MQNRLQKQKQKAEAVLCWMPDCLMPDAWRLTVDASCSTAPRRSVGSREPLVIPLLLFHGATATLRSVGSSLLFPC